ncbi:MAG: general secretion pathway protein GspB [Burkholderiales bacterium]|nr:general secretion pathway protein GspB [Burkholderiales bacterium]
MSYILDALRRAEADRERERGQVPGLHTQASSGSDAVPAAGQRRWLPWAGGGLLLLAGIGAGSWWASGSHEAPAAVAPPVSSPVPPPSPAPLATAAPPAEVATAPVISPASTAPPAPQPAASGSPYLAPAPPPGAVVAAKAAPVPAAPPAPAPAPAAETPIPRLTELPESTRRELPKLVISGSVYSEDPASRFVMVNGEVVREGTRLVADLVLEQIRPRELVFRFKGQRYRQPV